jgi:hypothetical protein
MYPYMLVKKGDILVWIFTPKCVTTTTTTSLRSTALEAGKKGEKFSLDFLYGKYYTRKTRCFKKVASYLLSEYVKHKNKNFSDHINKHFY